MKKLLTLGLCCIVAFGLWACGDDKKSRRRARTSSSKEQTETKSKDSKNQADAPTPDKPEVKETEGHDTSKVNEPPVSGGGAGSPEALFDAIKQAGLAKDFGAIYDLMSGPSLAQFAAMKEQAVGMMGMGLSMVPPETRAAAEAAQKDQLQEMFGVSSIDEVKAMSPRDFFVRTMSQAAKSGSESPFSELDKTELIKTELSSDGQRATLTTKDATGEEDKATIVLENGLWKFDFTEQMGGN